MFREADDVLKRKRPMHEIVLLDCPTHEFDLRVALDALDALRAGLRAARGERAAVVALVMLDARAAQAALRLRAVLAEQDQWFGRAEWADWSAGDERDDRAELAAQAALGARIEQDDPFRWAARAALRRASGAASARKDEDLGLRAARVASEASRVWSRF